MVEITGMSNPINGGSTEQGSLAMVTGAQTVGKEDSPGESEAIAHIEQAILAVESQIASLPPGADPSRLESIKDALIHGKGANPIGTAMGVGSLIAVAKGASDQATLRAAREKAETLLAAHAASVTDANAYVASQEVVGKFFERAEKWQESAIQAVRDKGEYTTSIEAFGYSFTESAFEQRIGELEAARDAAADGSVEKQALEQELKLVNDTRWQVLEGHTVKAMDNFRRDADPELLNKLDNQQTADKINELSKETLKDLPENTNKKALKLINAGKAIERVEAGKPLPGDEEFVNNLTPDEKEAIKEAYGDLNTERKAVQEKDIDNVNQMLMDMNKAREDIIKNGKAGGLTDKQILENIKEAQENIAEKYTDGDPSELLVAKAAVKSPPPAQTVAAALSPPPPPKEVEQAKNAMFENLSPEVRALVSSTFPPGVASNGIDYNDSTREQAPGSTAIATNHHQTQQQSANYVG